LWMSCTQDALPHTRLHILELVPWQGHTKTVGAFPLSHSITWRPRIWERPVLNLGTQKSWGVLVQHLQSYSDLPHWSILNRGSRDVAERPTRGGQKLQTYIYRDVLPLLGYIQYLGDLPREIWEFCLFGPFTRWIFRGPRPTKNFLWPTPVHLKRI
jgi:hypothetical protein